MGLLSYGVSALKVGIAVQILRLYPNPYLDTTNAPVVLKTCTAVDYVFTTTPKMPRAVPMIEQNHRYKRQTQTSASFGLRIVMRLSQVNGHQVETLRQR